MTNLDSIFKSRDITLSTKVHLVKAMVFTVVTYGCESWTRKKAECWRINVFELGCWRRLLRVPWTTRRSHQSILKEISPGYSLEGLMLKLKLQYFGHLMRGADSLEKTLMLGKIEDRRRRGQQRLRWLDGITDSMDMGLGELLEWWWTGRPCVLRFMGLQRVGKDWAIELNWILVTCSQFLSTKFTTVPRSSCNYLRNVCLPPALLFAGRNLICLICGQAQNGNALNRWIKWCRKERTPPPTQRCWWLWELKVTKTEKPHKLWSMHLPSYISAVIIFS